MNQKAISAALLQLSFVVLTITSGVFGGAAALLLSRIIGTTQFAILEAMTVMIFIYFKAYGAAVMLLSVGLLVLVYQVFDYKSLLFRGLAAALSCSSVLFIAAYLWARNVVNEPVFVWIEKSIQVYVEQARPYFGVNLDIKGLVFQTPSMVVTFLGITLWIGVMFDSGAQFKRGFLKTQKEIKNFRIPDGFIWITIAALLFSFLKTKVPGLQEVALNVLNVSLLLYFFQGLSVLSFLMGVLNFGVFLKMIVYVIFIAQLLLPICLGILDFWLNFRNKLSKKTDENA